MCVSPPLLSAHPCFGPAPRGVGQHGGGAGRTHPSLAFPLWGLGDLSPLSHGTLRAVVLVHPRVCWEIEATGRRGAAKASSGRAWLRSGSLPAVLLEA